jgi:hypothetical protein
VPSPFCTGLSRPALEQGHYFSRLRETPCLLFGKKQPPGKMDIEDATCPGNQGDRGVAVFFQFRCQPGSAGQVISAAAVGDGYFHGLGPVFVSCSIHSFYHTRFGL